MKVATNDIPAKIDSPGAVARQQPGFGDATDYGDIAAEHFTLAAGTDIAALLEGLEDDLCQSPHWGYIVSGALTVTYSDGSEEVDEGGDMFYWPPGHTVRADEDTEFVLFSPQHEHEAVLDHIRGKIDESS
jgi:mannose-6-phosphate isomerase-like protein (cupin superfamily)